MRRDVASLAAVLAAVLGVIAAFPFGAVGFRARSVPAVRPFAAFVTLGDKASAAALRAAKSNLGGETAAGRRPRVDISFGELPEERPTPVMEVSARTRPPSAGLVELGPVPYLPSLAAPPPAKIPVDRPAADEPVFSRQELLKLD